MRGLAARLRALFRRTVTDAELDEELSYHLDRQTERNIAAGMSGRDARDAARRSLGNLTVHAEHAREAFGWTWVEHLAQDAAYGWRALRRSRGFTVVAALSLALGIGANTMIFGVTYSVLLQPLPLPHPERLAVLERVAGTETDQSFSAAEVEGLRSAPGVVAMTAIRSGDNTPVVVDRQRTFTTLDFVDEHYFTATGLRPLRGRSIDSADVASGAQVAVISQPFAERTFGSAERALGQVVRVYDVPMSIVGVTPAAFRGLEYPGQFTIAVPVTLSPALGQPDVRHRPTRSFGVVVRLDESVTVAQRAATGLDAAFQQCCPHDTPERLVLVEMTRGIAGNKDDARAEYAPLLYILMAGAGVVLITACANVGNLLLVRAAARQREIAVRMSLGASRGRVIRQLVTESLLLGALGGALALPLAAWGTRGVERMIPAPMFVYADIVRWQPKPALLLFTAVISIACVTLFGLVPAFRATHTDLSISLKLGGRGTVGGRRRMLDRGVVVAQLSFALLLTSAASLLMTTLRNIAHEDGGFAASGVTLVSIETRGTPYERSGIVPLHAEILRRVRAVPGVEHAGMSTMMPIAGGRRMTVKLDASGEVAWRSIILAGVTPGYLASAGIALRAGRDFTDLDDAASERVAIISESVAQRALPGRNPLGASIRVRGDSMHVFRVVGVARDTKMAGLRGERVPVLYAPVTQTGEWPFLGLAVRIPDGAEALTRRVTSAVEAAAPGVRIRKISTMRGEIGDSMFSERLAASVATLFGGLALLLAAIGIYGVIAFNVARRTNEIGVRMALGATRVDVLGLVLRSSFVLLALAVVVGAPMAFMAGRALQSQLYGVSAHDPVLLLLALGLLGAIALLATAIPARRATRIDPLVALRAD
jgi:putative ABC transport system permease protein